MKSRVAFLLILLAPFGQPPAIVAQPAPKADVSRLAKDDPPPVDLKIVGPTKIEPYRMARFAASIDTTGYAVIWDVYPEEAVDIEETGKRLIVVAPPASYKLKLRLIKGDVVLTARASFDVGTPEPPKPPPGPGPGPTPGPTPSPAPIPDAGFRTLIIYESGDATKMSAAQQNILYGKAVRDYLNAKCIAEPDGTKAFRIYDQNVDVTAESTIWQNAMKRPRQSVPWLIASNGKTGFEGPLPANVDDFMKIIKPIAEAQ